MRPFLGPLYTALLVAILSLTIVPGPAVALPPDTRSTWAVGIAGGGTNSITIARSYSPGIRYPLRADGTLFTAIHLLHDIGGHFSILGQANYLSFGPGYESYRVQHLPIGVGARYRFVTGPSYRGSPYIDISPAIAWSRWQAPFNREAEVSFFRPALIAGLGAHGSLGGRVEMEIGLRYFLTTDGGERRSQVGPASHALEGLSEVGALVGLYYSL